MPRKYHTPFRSIRMGGDSCRKDSFIDTDINPVPNPLVSFFSETEKRQHFDLDHQNSRLLSRIMVTGPLFTSSTDIVV